MKIDLKTYDGEMTEEIEDEICRLQELHEDSIPWPQVGGDIDWADHGGVFGVATADGDWALAEVAHIDDQPEALAWVALVRPKKSGDLEEAMDMYYDGQRAILMNGVRHLVPALALKEAIESVGHMVGDGEESRKELKKCLRKPANAIGTTGADMLKGHVLAGLERAAKREVFEGKPMTDQQRLVAKMYTAAGGQTLGGEKIDTMILLAGAGENK